MKKKQALLKSDAPKVDSNQTWIPEQATDALQLLMLMESSSLKREEPMMVQNRSRHPLLPSAPSIDHRKVSSRSLENADKWTVTTHSVHSIEDIQQQRLHAHGTQTLLRSFAATT